jgi:hypothetical protein
MVLRARVRLPAASVATTSTRIRTLRRGRRSALRLGLSVTLRAPGASGSARDARATLNALRRALRVLPSSAASSATGSLGVTVALTPRWTSRA